MKLSRIKAIIYKDYKEVLRNPSLYLMMVIPILMAIYFKFLSQSLPNNSESTSLEPLLLLLVLSFSIVAPLGTITITILAEENEKSTLNSLIETPMKPFELLIGKIILGIVISIFTSIIAVTILPFSLSLYWYDWIGLCMFIILIGCIALIFGLLSSTVGQASFYAFIILLLSFSLFSEIFKEANISNWFIKILDFFPTNLIYYDHVHTTPFNLIYLLIWCLFAYTLLHIVYITKTRKH